ncbi:MAG: hypothetical protein HN878_03785 [Candidatus Diapherotrites archaeon]|nr:hypothetical protein [Candidatus Diapherotrites archaeon]
MEKSCYVLGTILIVGIILIALWVGGTYLLPCGFGGGPQTCIPATPDFLHIGIILVVIASIGKIWKVKKKKGVING